MSYATEIEAGNLILLQKPSLESAEIHVYGRSTILRVNSIITVPIVTSYIRLRLRTAEIIFSARHAVHNWMLNSDTHENVTLTFVFL